VPWNITRKRTAEKQLARMGLFSLDNCQPYQGSKLNFNSLNRLIS
jgi:hypothetical protein